MTDSYDRSYYEIALTNGQVLVALGILLGCVVGAFLSGLWVAKKALDRRPAVVESLAAVEPDAETFEFFGAAADAETPTLGEESSGEVASQSDSQATRDDASAGAATNTAITARPDPARPASAKTVAQAADSPSGVAVTDSRRDVPEQSAPSRASSPVQTDRSANAASAPGATVVIQVFSSSDQAQANNLVNKLRDAGYRAFVSPVQVDGRTMHRVRVGPFQAEQEAKEEAAEIKRTFKLDTWITAG